MTSGNTNRFIDRDDVLAQIVGEFSARNPAYSDRRRALKQKLAPLADQLNKLQESGHPMGCPEQIMLEVQWLLNYRDDWDRAERRLADLTTGLADIGQAEATQGDDGSWGSCYEEWYRKLEPTVDALQTAGLDASSLKPLLFMQRLEDATAVLDYLYRLQTTDIRANGRNERDELGAVQSALSQLIFKDELRDTLKETPALGFTISDELEALYGDYLKQTQHPRTGYWGPWYRFSDRLVMVQDLSFTFHIVNYQSGNIANWPLVIDTTLAIKPLRYPMGWRPDADTQYSNHNNYDIATIFCFGWPHMTSNQKEAVRAEIAAMLDWCLTESVDGDGFKDSGDSDLDAYYFGVRFLDRVGFWDQSKRFWSRRDPSLPRGAATPSDLCRRLQRGFTHLNANSEEADTIHSLLATAVCMTSGSLA
ncbi:MAG TPA: hypothetical protein VKG22_02575 [Stellaceae bacterium]|nr:hypothetical protein [Stellaceae bacterium]